MMQVFLSWKVWEGMLCAAGFRGEWKKRSLISFLNIIRQHQDVYKICVIHYQKQCGATSLAATYQVAYIEERGKPALVAPIGDIQNVSNLWKKALRGVLF